MLDKLLKITLVALILILGYLLFDFYSFSSSNDQKAIDKGIEATAAIDEQINHMLTEVMELGDQLQRDLESKSYSKEELELYLKEKTLLLDQLLGITIAYEPYAFNENKRLYSPYYDRVQDKVIALEDIYDYTDASITSSKWYVQPLDNGALWTEPYYGQAAQTLVADYTFPFYEDQKEKNVKGVIALTISLKQLTEITRKLSLGKTGYAFIASKENNILAHPINTYIGKKKLDDLSKQELAPEIAAAYRDMEIQDSGNAIGYSKLKKQEVLFFYDLIKVSQWKIGVTFFKNDLLGNKHLYKRKYLNLAIVVSLLLVVILALYFNRDFLSVKEIWRLSQFATLILLLNLLFAGYLEYNAITPLLKGESPPITNENTLSVVVNDELASLKQRNKKSLITIPTGIFIDALAFEDSYNVNISGTVWQKYDRNTTAGIERGISFPQTAPFAEASYIEESYREEFDDYTLIGYQFRQTLKLKLQYADYPFDKQHLHIALFPVDLEKNILLTPDFDSYLYNSPTQLSGVSQQVAIEGSELKESYFSYTSQSYGTNFGFKNISNNNSKTNLYFNLNLKRRLITSFVTYLIPIFVTLVLIFIMIMSVRSSKKEESSGMDTVQAMGAFFFVLVFSHIDLRKTIESSDLIFMEYFYFISYFVIILATFNLILFKNRTLKIFNYKNNLFAKTTFWPLFLLMVLIVSWIKFY